MREKTVLFAASYHERENPLLLVYALWKIALVQEGYRLSVNGKVNILRETVAPPGLFKVLWAFNVLKYERHIVVVFNQLHYSVTDTRF